VDWHVILIDEALKTNTHVKSYDSYTQIHRQTWTDNK